MRATREWRTPALTPVRSCRRPLPALPASVGPTPNNSEAEQPGQPKRTREPHGRADRRDGDPLSHDERNDARARRAKCEANADLPRRSATMNESTPYVPTSASSSASPANAASNCARSRGRPIDSSNTVSISRKPTIGTEGLTAWTARSNVAPGADAREFVRSTMCMVGSAVGGDPALRAVDRTGRADR